MKANAPKKIYIPRLEGNKSFVHEWSATKFRKYFSREIAENVEYTRTDAFIEKARKWFEEHFGNRLKWEITTYEFEDIQSMVDNFKNYMKGE